jgi:hypothetical protein
VVNGGLYLLDVIGIGCETNNAPRDLGFQLSCQTLPTIRGSNLFVSVQRVGLVKAAGANLFEMIYSSACNVIENPQSSPWLSRLNESNSFVWGFLLWDSE